MNENLTVRDIILWIMDNSDDQMAMDKISYAVFPYSTKYKKMFTPHHSDAYKENDTSVDNSFDHRL